MKYLTARSSFAKNPCRSPYGERGLKYNGQKAKSGLNKSLSLRRAWIEIAKRGTKHPFQTSRSPYGERGLKLPVVTGLGVIGVSLSLRRAWIEILTILVMPTTIRSLSLRRAWIEIVRDAPESDRPYCRSPYGERGLKFVFPDLVPTEHLSLSLRRAWIEISLGFNLQKPNFVALLTESVD